MSTHYFSLKRKRLYACTYCLLVYVPAPVEYEQQDVRLNEDMHCSFVSPFSSFTLPVSPSDQSYRSRRERGGITTFNVVSIYLICLSVICPSPFLPPFICASALSSSLLCSLSQVTFLSPSLDFSLNSSSPMTYLSSPLLPCFHIFTSLFNCHPAILLVSPLFSFVIPLPENRTIFSTGDIR